VLDRLICDNGVAVIDSARGRFQRRRAIKVSLVRRGLYRFEDPDGAACCCVHWTAGDGAPFLSRQIYEMLGFEPRFDNLPEFEDYARDNREAPVPLTLRAARPGQRPTITA